MNDAGERALRGGDGLLMVIVAGLAFALVAPTLRWIEFSGGSENLVVATALEIRRSDHWMIPTLQGEPRTRKPPLTAWIAAGLIRQSTLAMICSPDPAVRDAGYEQLAWDIRWPALLAACLTAAAVYELGRLGGGMWLGLVSALIYCTNYAFLRFCRGATTDVQLALWVTVANVFLARAILRRQYWLGFIGAGAALGLAFMSKGPVAVAQSIFPAAVFAFIDRRRRSEQKAGRPFLPALAGFVVMLAIALPWFVLVMRRYDAMGDWWREVTRRGATANEPSAWWAYASFFPMLLPWVLYFVAGAARIGLSRGMEEEAGQRRAMGLMLTLVVAPIVLMTLFQDRKERYLLPMIGPAAVVAAYGLLAHLDRFRSGWRTREEEKWDRALSAGQWIILFLAGVAFPIAGATRLTHLSEQDGGGPWFSPALAAGAASGGAVILGVGLLLQRRRPYALVAAGVSVICITGTLFAWGYARSDNGRDELKPMAEKIWQVCPKAAVYTYTPGRAGPQDLSIYLNRSTPSLDAEGLAKLPPSPMPQAVVTIEKKDREPPVIPAGWERVYTVRRGRSLWHLYLRRSAD